MNFSIKILFAVLFCSFVTGNSFCQADEELRNMRTGEVVAIMDKDSNYTIPFGRSMEDVLDQSNGRVNHPLVKQLTSVLPEKGRARRIITEAKHFAFYDGVILGTTAQKFTAFNEMQLIANSKGILAVIENQGMVYIIAKNSTTDILNAISERNSIIESMLDDELVVSATDCNDFDVDTANLVVEIPHITISIDAGSAQYLNMNDEDHSRSAVLEVSRSYLYLSSYERDITVRDLLEESLWMGCHVTFGEGITLEFWKGRPVMAQYRMSNLEEMEDIRDQPLANANSQDHNTHEYAYVVFDYNEKAYEDITKSREAIVKASVGTHIPGKYAVKISYGVGDSGLIPSEIKSAGIDAKEKEQLNAELSDAILPIVKQGASNALNNKLQRN